MRELSLNILDIAQNSISAGASLITIDVSESREEHLLTLTVSDNGCGMSPEDARTAFLRHATSKIRNKDDLAAISTLGFRGEALAARPAAVLR